MNGRTVSPHTIAAFVVALAALALPATAATAVDAGPRLRFSALPERAVQGREARVAVAAATGARCTLVVRYGNGRLQAALPPAKATHGRASWHWRVPETAATGPAKLIAACGTSRLTASLPVVAGTRVPGVTVTKRGFSQRFRFGKSTVSYGVVLTNTSAERDALGVVVLVNFVDATNTVLGTAEVRIDGIAAKSPYYLGGSITLPSVEVARLEVSSRVAERAPRAIHEPRIADLRLTPALDTAYVGAVEGQVLNDKPATVLTRASLSAVFLDSGGRVLGGAEGTLRAALPSGVREYFSLTRGADSVLLASAAEARVSIEPTYDVRP